MKVTQDGNPNMIDENWGIDPTLVADDKQAVRPRRRAPRKAAAPKPVAQARQARQTQQAHTHQQVQPAKAPLSPIKRISGEQASSPDLRDADLVQAARLGPKPLASKEVDTQDSGKGAPEWYVENLMPGPSTFTKDNRRALELKAHGFHGSIVAVSDELRFDPYLNRAVQRGRIQFIPRSEYEQKASQLGFEEDLGHSHSELLAKYMNEGADQLTDRFQGRNIPEDAEPSGRALKAEEILANMEKLSSIPRGNRKVDLGNFATREDQLNVPPNSYEGQNTIISPLSPLDVMQPVQYGEDWE